MVFFYLLPISRNYRLEKITEKMPFYLALRRRIILMRRRVKILMRLLPYFVPSLLFKNKVNKHVPVRVRAIFSFDFNCYEIE
jgi:hypothetical protein